MDKKEQIITTDDANRIAKLFGLPTQQAADIFEKSKDMDDRNANMVGFIFMSFAANKMFELDNGDIKRTEENIIQYMERLKNDMNNNLGETDIMLKKFFEIIKEELSISLCTIGYYD